MFLRSLLLERNYFRFMYDINLLGVVSPWLVLFVLADALSVYHYFGDRCQAHLLF